MSQVSSINLSVMTGDRVKNRQELSWCESGGSIIVLCFEEKAKAEMFVDQKKHHLIGQEMCQLR